MVTFHLPSGPVVSTPPCSSTSGGRVGSRRRSRFEVVDGSVAGLAGLVHDVWSLGVVFDTGSL
jgi:hypothetical protein